MRPPSVLGDGPGSSCTVGQPAALATGVGLRYGLRPMHDHHGLSQSMTITRWPFHIPCTATPHDRSPAGVLRTDTLEIVILRSREIDPLDGWGDEAVIAAVQKALADDDVIARVQIIESLPICQNSSPGQIVRLSFPTAGVLISRILG